MKLIVVTAPTFFVEEDKIITALFEEGLDILHLRKPETPAMYSERLLTLIPEKYHKRIITHEHFYLQEEFSLMGIHLNTRNSKEPHDYSGHISCTCHSLLAGERDAGLHAAARGLLPEHGDGHAGQDGEHGPADDGELLPDEPARQCEGEAYSQAGYVLQGVGHGRSFCYRTGARSVCVSDGVRVYHCRVAVAVIELATILKIYEHMFVNL